MALAMISELPRTAAGRFAPGHSGNPLGRPKGARNRATLAAEALLGEHAEPLVRKLINDGLGGDGQALRFLIGRFWPAAKDRPITLDVAPGKEGDLVHIHSLVIRAMADGEITPQEALAASRVVAVGAKLIALQRRLEKAAGRTAPVSGQYFEAKSGKAACRLPTPPSQAGEGETAAMRKSPSAACEGATGRAQLDAAAPVAGQYFSASTQAAPAPVSGLYFSRAPRPALFASTALGRVEAGKRLYPPVNSRRAGSTGRAAA